MDHSYTSSTAPTTSAEAREADQPLATTAAGPSTTPADNQPSLLEVMANQYFALQRAQQITEDTEGQHHRRGQLATTGLEISYDQSPEGAQEDEFAFTGQLSPRQNTFVAGPHLLTMMSPVRPELESQRGDDGVEPNGERQGANEEANAQGRSNGNQADGRPNGLH